MSNILYLGDNDAGTTSGHRMQALIRLGHTIDSVDPYKRFADEVFSRWKGPIHFRTGYRMLNRPVDNWLQEIVRDKAPDLVWVDGGELLGSSSLKILKHQLKCPIVLYNTDDPAGTRDGRRFDTLRKAFPYYDLVVIKRGKSVAELERHGVKKVLSVFMSYDEELHKPFPSQEDIPKQFLSDVAFIGTWMRYEDRDEFILSLIKQGIPVSIWGNRWEKSPNFSKLKNSWRGNALTGRDYVAAIQGAKICLGLLSKGNRDLHTSRSSETTYASGLLCAERTSDHLEMYREGVEAVFWKDVNECASVCKDLLADEGKRNRIRAAGRARVMSLQIGNEDVCRRILETV